jgi:hypothetical protein
MRIELPGFSGGGGGGEVGGGFVGGGVVGGGFVGGGVVGGAVVGGAVVGEVGDVVGLTLPPPDSSRPGGIENGSRAPARSTGGSVSRGVGDGVTLGVATGPPVAPVGNSGSATSSPPLGRNTKK